MKKLTIVILVIGCILYATAMMMIINPFDFTVKKEVDIENIITLLMGIPTVIGGFLVYFVSSKTLHMTQSADVVITLEAQRSCPQLCNIVLHNIGNGVAKKVKVKIDGDLQEKGWPIKLKEVAFLNEEIPFLKSGGKHSAYFGKFVTLLDEDKSNDIQKILDENPVKVTWIDYKGKTQHNTFRLSIKHFNEVCDRDKLSSYYESIP